MMHFECRIIMSNDCESDVSIQHLSLCEWKILNISPDSVGIAQSIHLNDGEQQMVLLASTSTFC